MADTSGAFLAAASDAAEAATPRAIMDSFLIIMAIWFYECKKVRFMDSISTVLWAGSRYTGDGWW